VFGVQCLVFGVWYFDSVLNDLLLMISAPAEIS